ncbi:MAG TPA: LysR family transcriptional regulator [Rhizomicrobium sp.]|nr:LysR family transcriptional regulator [Rhizomicrobium sp.]
MQTKDERGVPSDAHPDRRHTPDWEGTRIFLETVRRGSFRSASESLGMSLNAVRRHFDDFERDCGVVLAMRGTFGIQLTPEGERIFAAAEKMESAFFDVVRARDQSGGMEGRVKLAVTEGLGTFWIGPRLIEFQRAFPKLMIDMRCTMSPADILRLEAQVSVQLTIPEDKELKAVRIGRLHAMPFASASYVRTYGKPATVADFAKHRIVMQVSPNIPSELVFQQLFPGAPVESLIVFQSNVSSAHYWSIAKGAGIGILPTYANAMGAPVVPVDIRDNDDPTRLLRWHSDIWLAYHPDAARIPRVRRLIEWLREAFAPKQFPWFSDDFVHPGDLPLTVDGLPLINMFAGFSAKDTDEPVGS